MFDADSRSPRSDQPAQVRPGEERAGPAIERFAVLLDETGTGRHHHRPQDVDPELLALLGVTHRLARSAMPTIRPQFRDQLLSDLMAAWQTEGPGAANNPAPPPTRHGDQAEVVWPVNGVPAPRRSADDAAGATAVPADVETQAIRTVRSRRGPRTRLAMVIGLATGTLAISGVSLASTGANPGDPLYPVKGWGEQAQLMFAGTDAQRGQLHLDFARMRLVEARSVGPAGLAGVLGEMDREVTEGARLVFSAAFSSGDASLLASVTSFVQQQRADLTQLRTDLPTAEDPAAASFDLLAAVELRARELQAALAEGCTSSETDRFGPRPTC